MLWNRLQFTCTAQRAVARARDDMFRRRVGVLENRGGSGIRRSETPGRLKSVGIGLPVKINLFQETPADRHNHWQLNKTPDLALVKTWRLPRAKRCEHLVDLRIAVPKCIVFLIFTRFIFMFARIFSPTRHQLQYKEDEVTKVIQEVLSVVSRSSCLSHLRVSFEFC